MGVHPLLLFAGLLIGAKFGGVWGALFAGPVVAIAYAMFEVFYDRYQRSSPHFPDMLPLAAAESAAESAPVAAPARRVSAPPVEVVSPGMLQQPIPQTQAAPEPAAGRSAEEPSLRDR